MYSILLSALSGVTVLTVELSSFRFLMTGSTKFEDEDSTSKTSSSTACGEGTSMSTGEDKSKPVKQGLLCNCEQTYHTVGCGPSVGIMKLRGC